MISPQHDSKRLFINHLSSINNTTMNVNGLMKYVLDNKDHISNVHCFDPVKVSGYHVMGVEVRVKEGVLTNTLNYENVSMDAFRLGEPGYIYLVIGSVAAYCAWIEMKWDGLVADKVCRKFNWFENSNIPQDVIADYRENVAEIEVRNKYHEAWEAIYHIRATKQSSKQ